MCGILFLLLSKGLVLLKEHAVAAEDTPSGAAAINVAEATANGNAAIMGTHLRLRGLPWDVNEEAVIRFLKPVTNVTESDVCVCLGLDVSKSKAVLGAFGIVRFPS